MFGRALVLTSALLAVAGLTLVGCSRSAPAVVAPTSGTTSSGSSAPDLTPQTGDTSTFVASGTVPKTCPSATAVSGVIGTSVTMQVSPAGDATSLTCTYNGTSSGVTLDFVYAAEQGLTAAQLEAIEQNQARAQKATVTPLAGLGQAAYTFTEGPAASDGLPTIDITALIGSGVFVSLAGDLSLAHMEAAARLAMAAR